MLHFACFHELQQSLLDFDFDDPFAWLLILSTHHPIETCFQTTSYRAQKQHVLRQQSEGAEGDGPAHQPDFQVPFIPFYVPGSFEVLFRYLQNRTRVSVWLYENVNTRIEGHITGDFELFLQEVQSMS